MDTLAGKGRRQIANAMNARGIQTWGEGNSQGVRWHDSYIQKTLLNPAVIGIFVPKGKLAGGTDEEADEPIKDYFPPVIDAETFWKAQVASKGRGMGKGNAGVKHRNVLLLGNRLNRECCGANMVFIDKGRRSKGPKLRCGNAHQSAGCGHRDLYEYKPIEIGVIFGLGPKRAMLAATVDDALRTAESALAVAVTKRDEKQKEIDRILDALQGGAAIRSVAERLRRLDDELGALRGGGSYARTRCCRGEEADPEGDMAGPRCIYRELDSKKGEEKIFARAEMREKLTRLLDAIIVGPSGVECRYKANWSTSPSPRWGMIFTGKLFSVSVREEFGSTELFLVQRLRPNSREGPPMWTTENCVNTPATSGKGRP